MTKIRKAKKEDLDALNALENAIFVEEADIHLFDDYFEGNTDSEISGALCYVVDDNQQLVGYILVDLCGYIMSLGITEKYRRKGFATNLMRVIEEELIKNRWYLLNMLPLGGNAQMHLHVNTTNEGAIQLYKTNGYTIVKTVKNCYRDSGDAYIMTKYLS